MEFNNPFSFYDFLGYMLPGLFLVVGIVYIADFPDYQQFLNTIKIENYSFIILLILLCYLLGHIISFLSSITVEKFAVWTIGYPSRYLFEKEREGFYRSTMDKFHKEEKKRYGAYLRLVARLIIKTIIWILLLPISVFDIIARKALRLNDQYARSLDPDLLEVLSHTLNSFLDKEYNRQSAMTQDHDYFRLIYHYALEHSENHAGKMQNYVALYGFTRTNTLNFALFFWFALYRMITTHTLAVYFGYLIGISVISFILYLAYLKFSRKFTLEAIMALTVSYGKSND